jgi:hypothetical protein
VRKIALALERGLRIEHVELTPRRSPAFAREFSIAIAAATG